MTGSFTDFCKSILDGDIRKKIVVNSISDSEYEEKYIIIDAISEVGGLMSLIKDELFAEGITANVFKVSNIIMVEYLIKVSPDDRIKKENVGFLKWLISDYVNHVSDNLSIFVNSRDGDMIFTLVFKVLDTLEHNIRTVLEAFHVFIRSAKGLYDKINEIKNMSDNDYRLLYKKYVMELLGKLSYISDVVMSELHGNVDVFDIPKILTKSDIDDVVRVVSDMYRVVLYNKR